MLWSAAAIASAAGQPVAPRQAGTHQPTTHHPVKVPPVAPTPTPPAMPPDVNAAVVLEDGQAWRNHEPTRRLFELAERIGVFGDLGRAWAELATAVGMEGPQAFDALLGKHAVLVTAPAVKGNAAWAILTTSTKDIAETLERRLDAAPRGFKDGEPVVLAERGKFRLERIDERPATGELGIVVTPTAVPTMPDMARSAAAALARVQQKPGETLAYWKATDAGAYILTRFRRSDDGVLVTLEASPEALGLTPAGVANLAKAEPAPATGPDRVLLEIAGRSPGGIPALTAATTEFEAVLKAAKIPIPESALAGERCVIRVVDTDGVLVLLVAAEVRDITRASQAYDAMMASLLELASPGGSGIRREIEQAREDPLAVRLAVLSRGKNTGSTLAWTYVPGVRDGDKTPGWWVVEYRAAAIARDQAEKFVRETAGEVAARVWGRDVFRVIARPAKFWTVSGLEKLGEEAHGLSLLKEFERVELRLEAVRDRVEGTGEIRLTPRIEPPK